MKINMGCGREHQFGWVNVDSWPGCQPDLVLDLENIPWPWPDSSVAALRAHHSLEHMGQTPAVFLGIMREAHRVLAPAGRFEITFPDIHSDGWWGDPTHVRPLSPAVFQLFSRQTNEATLARGWPNTPLALMLNIDFRTISCSCNLSGSVSKEQAHHYNNSIDEWTVILEAQKETSQ